jgi:phage terminase large subunit
VTWPPDYVDVYAARLERLRKCRALPELWQLGRAYYADKPVEWIEHWAVTYDPRNAHTDVPTTLPFMLFDRQRRMVEWLHDCVRQQVDGLNEKSRDVGATWVCCAFSVWLWLYWPGADVGWGSRKEDLVDRIGIVDSIFEKIRIIISNLPREMLPVGFDKKAHMPFMRILNPETNSSIAGESGDNIGRGGRKLIYFKDEAAHYERPEKIEAALSDTTRCQIDISSVNGLGNVFHRRRESGVEWQPGAALSRTSANVFVTDWRDHPLKTQQWYDDRKASAANAGLLHVFAQEVDRDYSAAVAGVIIPAEWVSSAIDAHIKLGFGDDGAWRAGFDPFDEGGDMHGFAVAKGVVLHSVEAWGEGDTGTATRRVVESLTGKDASVQYDPIGVGAGVKSEVNRLVSDGLMPKGLRFVPWNAGAAPFKPDERVVPRDKESPTNKEMFANLKAQGWWQLRMRFERTHRDVTEGVAFDPDELISLPSTLPNLQTLRKELSQTTRGKTGALKMIVDKSPEGTRSPNMADAVVMMMHPVGKLSLVFGEAAMRAIR